MRETETEIQRQAGREGGAGGRHRDKTWSSLCLELVFVFSVCVCLVFAFVSVFVCCLLVTSLSPDMDMSVFWSVVSNSIA